MSKQSPEKPSGTPDQEGAVVDAAASCDESVRPSDEAAMAAATAAALADAAIDATTAPTAVESPLATLAAELDEAKNRNLRLQAELENVRKRMQRAAEEERRYANLPLLRDLLPVIDNLQRAILAAGQHENATALLEGVQLVAGQLEAVLQRHHCTAIAAQGAAFDPHVHEAIAQHPSPDHEPGHVCLVTQTGYQLHDRVIRPAQVIVAAPRTETVATPQETRNAAGT